MHGEVVQKHKIRSTELNFESVTVLNHHDENVYLHFVQEKSNKFLLLILVEIKVAVSY